MLNTHDCCPATDPTRLASRPASVGWAIARRIANIAGIHAGDRVHVADTADTPIKAVVIEAGGQVLSDADKPRHRTPRDLCDVVFCALPAVGKPVADLLRRARRQLRPGGRVVIWTAPVRPTFALRFINHFQCLMDTTGWTSIIIGRLPTDAGNVVVATGIVGPTKTMGRKKEVIRGAMRGEH